MSLPVIDTAQSILGFKQGESFTFQPGIFIASGTLHVAATGLPTGITISSTTGLLTCDGTTPAGIYVIGVRADDGSLFTAAAYFTIGIEASTETSAGSNDAAIDIDIDVITRKATLRGVSVADGEPLLDVTANDVLVFNIRYFKYGIQLDPECTSVVIAFKDVETDAEMIKSEEFDAVNSGATALFRIAVALSAEALDAAHAEAEGADATSFVIVNTEIEMKKPVTVGSITEQIMTSVPFKTRIEREIATN